MAGITIKSWKERLAERADLSTSLVHLTRPVEKNMKKTSALQVLIKILHQKTLKGSTTNSGFIVGDKPAVCFQDAPLYSITQNVYYEQKYRSKVPEAKLRYLGFGIAFPKTYVFKKGGRPVVYDITEDAKSYLPAEQYWRIVKFDMRYDNAIVDWTHEREWRVPGNLSFELSEATILLPNSESYRHFIKLCNKYQKKFDTDIVGSIRGIVVLGALIY